MIFVTVGTHEQPFNRLIRYIDEMKANNIIKEDVFMQIGYSTYTPKHCAWEKVIPYDEMMDKMRLARIVIAHGGPATFIQAFQNGKIPIIVPRKSEFGEHVNNHQCHFVDFFYNKYKTIIPIYDIEQLKDTILGYESICANLNDKLSSNNKLFNENLSKIIDEMFE